MPPSTPAIIPDTNFLLDCPEVHREKWRLRPLEILVPETVMRELRGLSNSDDKILAERAAKALSVLEALRASPPPANPKGNVRVTFLSREPDVRPPLQAGVPDHRLIALAREWLIGQPPRFCAILTHDRRLSYIAEALAVLVVIPDASRRFHEELRCKYEWWQSSHTTAPDDALPSPLASFRSPRPASHATLDDFVQDVHRRLAAMDHRALLFLAPLQARLALTAKIVAGVPDPARRTVFVVVESSAACRFWAGELRQRWGFSPSEVQVFGQDDVERLDRARAVLYRHDQVVRRLPVHAARLAQAGRALTVVVDGCDLLDPVSLSLLLYESDQFVGYNHYPVEHAQAPGNRMLGAFLRNRMLLSYSFADADRDGWGRPVDFHPRPIAFAPEERAYWDGLNADYLRIRERAIARHPKLADADAFWETLLGLLESQAVPEEAELIRLWEQREQTAQLAQGKLETVTGLLKSLAAKGQRGLVFDHVRLWTPVLLKQLTAAGLRAAELPAEGDPEPIWSQFIGGKLDALLITRTPALDLPGAHIHQLILLTPLCPMAQLNAMVDWALSHTQAREPLRVETLYVDDTPEALAMLELAEGGFGLRY